MEPATRWAELAAELARAAGAAATACLGCLEGGSAVGPLISLSRSPPGPTCPELGQLLLVVGRVAADFEMERWAAAAVPEVWLYDEAGDLLTALSRPLRGVYRRRSLILPGEPVRLVALPEVELVPLPAHP